MTFLIPTSIPARAPSLVSRTAEWRGQQGTAWARRNPPTVEALDESYLQRFGITRTALNREMLAGVPVTASVLEVGCSAGRQLDVLGAMGFKDLKGVDIAAGALATCHWPSLVADATCLPFPDKHFDLVMTSGTLMQIPPQDKWRCVAEMKRVSRRWLYCCEVWTALNTTWDYSDLMPPSWTCDWVAIMDSPEWPVVRSRILDSGDKSPLEAFLMDKRA